MSNFYLKTPDWLHYLASDDWDCYRYHRMQDGYHKECYTEKEFIEKYGSIMEHAI